MNYAEICIIKRDGKREDFSISKIKNAVTKDHSCAIVVSQLCQADVTVVTGRCHILALSLSVV